MKHPERGAAIVVVLVLAVALVMLGSSLIKISMNDRSISANDADGSGAFNLAEAGLEHAIAEIPDRDIDVLLTAGGALFTNEALGDGSYSVTVSNNVAPDYPTGAIAADPGGASDDTDNLVVVTSTGTLDAASRRVRVIVELSGSAPTPFTWAAFGIDELKASNSTINGPVGSNGKVTFSGSGPRVYGDAQAGTTISDPTEYVTGTATEYAPPESFPPVACPAQAYGPAPTGDFSFDPSNGKISIGGPTTFPDGTYFFSELSKSGGDDITVPLGANVQIYISNKMSMSGGGFTNLNGTAKSLQIWGCSPGGTGDFSITGPQTVWFTLYAPSHKVKFTGEGDKHGSFIGLKWENSGPGNAYYDSALGSSGGGGPGGIKPGTWTEIW